jgi:hypothetical protein
MTNDTETFVLEALQGQQEAEKLCQFLQMHVARPVRINLSAVTDATAARLELLVGAQKQRMTDGVPMTLTGMAETFRNGLTRMGVPANFFEEERP